MGAVGGKKSFATTVYIYILNLILIMLFNFVLAAVKSGHIQWSIKIVELFQLSYFLSF